MSAQKRSNGGKGTDCESCSDSGCSAKSKRAGENAEERAQRQALARRLCAIERKLLVLSGKGGVGKSTVAVNLAIWLAMQGKRVGLLDVDIHGPSVPRMLGLLGKPIQPGSDGMVPVTLGGLRVMSIGFLLSSETEAVIWRGPRKMGAIRQFLADVDWGPLDYLVVDTPPGTGDEPLSICQLVEDADGAVIVTTPQEVALAAVRRSIDFCDQLRVPIVGVVENMSGYVCPKCKERTDVFKGGGGERMAREAGVPFLGRVPIDPELTGTCDEGVPYVQRFAGSATAEALDAVFRPVLEWRRPAVPER
jgi:Mrp family chromosome partitioning ATPase